MKWRSWREAGVVVALVGAAVARSSGAEAVPALSSTEVATWVSDHLRARADVGTGAEPGTAAARLPGSMTGGFAARTATALTVLDAADERYRAHPLAGHDAADLDITVERITVSGTSAHAVVAERTTLHFTAAGEQNPGVPEAEGYSLVHDFELVVVDGRWLLADSRPRLAPSGGPPPLTQADHRGGR
ncbi:hypothetical protein UO65_5842 [Actinokineospora spheciospongiae]|uniref:Nuclear transport factor 2 family protein n=1 Tax=Actinokineospora spheciospongiae TaxID=909613 RepID=W7IDA6_9PSEU|nr:hypothetical protein [Actinokineospora spheciospongiae]EWC58840.1 hypothetical protein UO65_5842 [Actinokineospora spheciospongiae]